LTSLGREALTLFLILPIALGLPSAVKASIATLVFLDAGRTAPSAAL